MRSGCTRALCQNVPGRIVLLLNFVEYNFLSVSVTLCAFYSGAIPASTSVASLPPSTSSACTCASLRASA